MRNLWNAPVMNHVTDNADARRWELWEQGLLAHADYEIRDGVMLLPHVEADPGLRGSGAAGRLMEGVAAHARARGLRLLPICGYAVAWLDKHPEHAELRV